MANLSWVLEKANGLKLQPMTPSECGVDEVQIEVHGSGINFADTMMVKGLYPDAPAYPFTPGYEVSGVVVALGAQVSAFKIGDPVVAGLCFGGYASTVNVPAGQCLALPSGLDTLTGASVVVSFLTAWLTLCEYARVRAGDRVLVDCASGALGSMLGHIARQAGAHLVGLSSSSSKKGHILKQYDEAYTHTEFQKTNAAFDIIVQSRGGPTYHQMISRLAPGGRMVALGISDLVSVKGWPARLNATLKTLWGLRPVFPATLMNGNFGLFGLNVLRLFDHPGILERGLGEFATYGSQVPIAATFEAQELELAIKQILDRKLSGKVILDWRSVHRDL